MCDPRHPQTLYRQRFKRLEFLGSLDDSQVRDFGINVHAQT